MLGSSLDEEVALNGEHDLLVGVEELDGNIVGEGRGERGHVEAELGLPVLTSNAGGDGARARVVGGGVGAVPGLVENDGTREAALEVDVSDIGVGDLPDASNVEVLGGALHDLRGVSVGLGGNDGEVLLSGGLSNHEVHGGCGGIGLVELGAGSDLSGSGGGENGSECGLEHFKKVLIIKGVCLGNNMHYLE